MDYTLNADRVVLQPSGIGADHLATNTLQSLFEDVKVSSIAFQSVLVAAIQIVERVREEEVAVSKAAISLAHRQQLSHLLASTDSMIQLLRSALNNQGSRILDLQPKIKERDGVNTSWWFCLAQAIETLDAGRDWIGLLVAGQNGESPTKKLGNVVAQFLDAHYSLLHAEISC